MSGIFLRSVELSNFRVYGESYAFEFPEGPGITLIVGANGLGKTSFFDAVEWALTNRVGRFSDIPTDARRKVRNPLTRIGAPEDSHRVSLTFSEGAPLDRGGGFVPEDGAIERLLKRPDWPEIGNLHGYLSITHFLGQSATRRFTLRDPKSQWEALKGPAGVDRINVLRERISGQGARLAFTRAIRDRGQKLEDASASLNSWRILVEDRDRLARLSSSEQSFSPKQVLETVEQLAQQVLPLLPQSRWAPVSPVSEAEGALNQLAQLLTDVRIVNEQTESRAAELERLCVDYVSAGERIQQKSSLARDITERRARISGDLIRAEASLAATISTVTKSKQRAAQIQARAASLARVSLAMDQMTRSSAHVSEAERHLIASRSEEERAEARLDSCRSDIEAAAAIRSTRSRVTTQIEFATLRATLSTSLRAVRAEMQRLQSLAHEIDASALRAKRSELTAQARVIDDDIDRLTIELRSRDERSRTLAEAVSRIAHQLSHDDKDCPVCASKFALGELKALALNSSRKPSAPASELGNALAVSKVTQEDVNRQLAAIDRQLNYHTELATFLAAESAREAALVQQVVEADGAADVYYDESDVTTLRGTLAEIDRQIAEGKSQEVLESECAEAQAIIDAERQKQASLERLLADASSDFEAARSALMQYPELWSTDTGLLVSLGEEQEKVQTEALAIGEVIAVDQRLRDEAQVSRDTIAGSLRREDASLATTNAELDELTEVRRGVVRRWNSLEQTGDPNTVRVLQLRAKIVERQARSEPIASMHLNLINGLRIWNHDHLLQERERAIATMVHEKQVTSESEVTELLQADIASAQEKLDLAQRARKRMEDVGTKMQASADQFADEVLMPLNDTIQRFSRTLMTWSDSSIVYRAEHHATRSELRPAVIRTDADGIISQVDINPNFFFSEGQLSALSVSALLAASTTFSWSRWRGLLLDDPLQHNDIIHASAFMDLLRQMVRELEYQVVVSTHDTSEAEFLARKCRSSGVPFKVHELVPRGDAGLVSAVA